LTYIGQWLVAFALTVGVEVVVAVPLLRGTGSSRLRRLGAVVLANLATHPVVWFVLPELGLGRGATLASEAWAVTIELFAYRVVFQLPYLRALGVAALANGASFAVGLVVRATTSWV